MGIPDFERPHVSILAHVCPVRRHERQDRVGAVSTRHVQLARGEHDARRETFDIPFPWCGKRLVEVVDVEEEPAFGAREATEVRGMTIAAGVNAYLRRRSRRQV